MTELATTRRAVLGGIAGTAALGVASARVGAATPPPLPSSPVTLNVIDVAGQLQLTQGAIQNFVRDNPKLISKVNFSQAPAPELPGKIKAQQAAGSVDIDLVMTGTDGLAAGIDGNLWIPLVTDYAAQLPDLKSIYLPGALKMQGLAQDQGVCVVFCPAGPIIEYMPDTVKTPPKTAQELLDWAKAHPKR
ncbi:MAG TPA: extracellular solute-binding protein, partial [Acetobacteraceae bacterium]